MAKLAPRRGIDLSKTSPLRVSRATVTYGEQEPLSPQEEALKAHDRANCERDKRRLDRALDVGRMDIVALVTSLPISQLTAIIQAYDKMALEVREADDSRALSQANYMIRTGHVTPQAVRHVRRKGTTQARTVALEQKRKLQLRPDAILRSVRARHSHLHFESAWGEAEAIFTEVNLDRRKNGLKRIGVDAIWQHIKRIDAKGKTS